MKEAYLDLTIGSRDLRPLGELPHIDIQKHYFSAGECHITLKDIKQLESVDAVNILAHGPSCRIEEILQANDILRRNGVKYIVLYMPYFYYSRQDRATTPESSFALKIFCEQLALAEFDGIVTHDLHSESINDIPNAPNVINHHPTGFLATVWDLNDYDYIIAPDKGAAKKISARR